jgi:hypothetical protein
MHSSTAAPPRWQRHAAPAQRVCQLALLCRLNARRIKLEGLPPKVHIHTGTLAAHAKVR